MEIKKHKITDEFGNLKAVYSYLFKFENEKDMLSGIKLEFENGEVYHEAEPDTDEITCNSYLKYEYQDIVDISNEKPWKEAIGKGVIWLWGLTNQQGYNDGIQYYFANTVEDKETIIQLIVTASEIGIWEINKNL